MATEPRTKHMLVDPTTSPMIPEFVLAPRLTDLENRVVGLIDDSKENAKEILEITVDVLKEKFGVFLQDIRKDAFRMSEQLTKINYHDF